MEGLTENNNHFHIVLRPHEAHFDIPTLANEVNESDYLQDFDPNKHKLDLRHDGITRVSHGATHANRVALLVRIIANLYRELGHPEALLLTEDDIKLLQVVALYHDTKRQNDYKDIWEFESRQACERKLMALGIEPKRARAFARLITAAAGEPKGQGMIAVPVKIGGQCIRTGDWIVGDDDGVVVIPQEKAVEVANRAQVVVERENREMAEIDQGSTLGKVSELMRWEQLRKKSDGKVNGKQKSG